MTPSQPCSPELRALLAKVNVELGTAFNAALVNKYNDGSDTIGAHSDAKDGLAEDGTVVVVSLGASRTFRVKKKVGVWKMDVLTSHGQLLVMEGPGFQRDYTHEVPKTVRVKAPRVSITLRHHVDAVVKSHTRRLAHLVE